ncbi:glycerophosphodiester phosphodiesterase [Parabacteroides sp. AF48-14]|uniref:glycerophosphodiester phosphodiesterase family protein n=1 Tax=Parabacteroides sp. AF48-14 TaxID=2292052 RepID=UPI000EFF763E|nr:glycerophosphodiester phosphodiesterase family protein [Parabacteroides sp. AF48-14]RHO71902.1 glycerophosphodiester phosphodiesterase [Parabacteroides sp. AF48-14]
MKRILFIIVSCLVMHCTLSAQESVQSLIQALRDPASKKVLVVSHRGDWRHAPENSLQAFENCIRMGVDMVEIDLKMTKDGHLVLMHDKTIDRTTDGKGAPSDYTLEEIRRFHLKDSAGELTSHVIPTFEEVLDLCKGKILINVDKGYEFFKEVYALTEQTGTTEQVVIKSGNRLKKVQEENGDVLNRVIYMPIISLDSPDASLIVDEYLAISPVAIECCFKTEMPEVIQLLQKIKSSGKTKIWINSLWPSLNAGHDDERAVTRNQPDESWGWILSQGASLIQTDRPAELLEYLEGKGRR